MLLVSVWQLPVAESGRVRHTHLTHRRDDILDEGRDLEVGRRRAEDRVGARPVDELV